MPRSALGWYVAGPLALKNERFEAGGWTGFESHPHFSRLKISPCAFTPNHCYCALHSLREIADRIKSTPNNNMKIKFLSAAISPALLLAALPAHAGVFNVFSWTGDGDSGLSSLTNYTAVADFNGDGTRVVNGVTFANTGASGSAYQLLSAPDTFGGFANALTGSSNLLASDFFFSGSTAGNANLTLTNLVPGQNYVTTWYNVGFGPAGGRFVNITPGDTGVPFLFDENQSGNGNGNLLTYSFTAVARQITFGFDAVSNGDSFHHYALTNAGPSGSGGPVLTVTPTYAAQNGPGPLTPFSPLNNDLLQTNLASAVGSGGNFSQEGTGGVPILTNGAFSITGVGGNNPQLATGQSGSSVLFTLDLSGAPFGFDISQLVGYGGWNDGGRDRQLYQVYYSVVGDSGFTLLGTANFDVANPGQPSAIRSTFDTALIGVDGVRIDFIGGQENGYAGYGEFDLVGVASVPEPGTAALAGLGLTPLAARRRRSAAASR